MKKDTWHMIERLKAAGISESDALALRRISMTLHRWHELECGDGNDYASWGIERDETTGKPYLVTHPHTGKSRRSLIHDREKGALKRLSEIVSRYPDFIPYVQGDPRGAALYMVPKSVLRRQGFNGSRDIESCYSDGIAVYK